MIVPASGAVLTADDKAAMHAAVDRGWLTAGPLNAQFESRLAKFTGIRNVRTCNSGSSANLLAVAAMVESGRWKRGDRVLTVAACFPTTVNPLMLYGLVPVFVDVRLGTYNVDVDQLRAAAPGAKGVMLAHTLGNPFDVDGVLEVCREHGLWLVEDCCFAAGTRIRVCGGERNIEDVRKGDFVLTRSGYREVLEAQKTGTKAVIEALGITATPDHPFITKGGVKRFDALSASDILYTWNEKQSRIEERPTGAIQSQQGGISAYIFGDTVGAGVSRFIGKCGSTVSAQFQRGCMSIMQTKIPSITNFQTLNFFLQSSILENIEPKPVLTSYTATSTLLGSRLPNGTEVKKVKNSTRGLQNFLGKISQCLTLFAKFAKENIKRIFRSGQKIALQRVKTEVAVFNLKIEGVSEFFANGILVHNCDALGATVDGVHVGNFGSVGTCSFFPAHHITTGEGGAVFTNDDELASLVTSLRDWGRDCWCAPGANNTCGRRYEWTSKEVGGSLPDGYDHKGICRTLGFNLKGTEIGAACGLSQAGRLPGIVARRRANYRLLGERLHAVRDFAVLPTFSEGSSPFGFPITLKETGTRRDLQRYLTQEGVDSRTLFSGNITRHPYMAGREWLQGSTLEVTDRVMDSTFWIGCHPELDEAQLAYSAQKVGEFLGVF